MGIYLGFMPIIRVLLFAFIFVGCGVKIPSAELINQEVRELQSLMVGLNPQVREEEAFDLAQRSIYYSLKLSKQYHAISSPWIQNTLVNLGLKKRGLCYEWAEDLLRYLVQKNYQTLEFHAISANVGYLNEHNALAVSAKGEGIAKSIVLDAWRHAGHLYFKKIDEDKKYEWRERKGLYGILPTTKE
jgi:hypothetical protein